MSWRYLGQDFDIHGGGSDLIFPHHENERAQSLCAFSRQPFRAPYWLHNGMLQVNGEKMSKSLGNGLLVHELVKAVPGEVVRWALLSAHYRAPLDWTGELLEQSRRALDRLYRVLHDAARAPGAGGEADAAAVAALVAPVIGAVEDDLNTPAAIAELFKLADRARAALSGSAGEAAAAVQALREAGGLLGLLQAAPGAWFQGAADGALKLRVETLIVRRAEARRAKDWPAADRIRGELTELGVEVLDGLGGAATWRLREEAASRATSGRAPSRTAARHLAPAAHPGAAPSRGPCLGPCSLTPDV